MTTTRIVTVTIAEDTTVEHVGGADAIYAGAYRLEIPADYDPSLITAADIRLDPGIRVVEDGPEAQRVNDAIRDSIRENRIVTVAARYRSEEWESMETSLAHLAEGSAEIVDAAEDIALRQDYWGTTEDGDEWRIYLDGFRFEVGEHGERLKRPEHFGPRDEWRTSR